MNAKSAKERWWSVPQAIVWIVSRSETAADSARDLSFFANLPPLRMIPTSPGDEPPISLEIAPRQLLQAARAGQIAVFGWERGRGKSVRVPAGDLMDSKWDTRDGGIAIMNRSWPAIYWSNLAIHAEECMSQWPAPVHAPTVSSTEVAAQSAPAASIITPAPHSPRKRGVAGKDDSDLLAKVRCAMDDNPALALYAAVQRHCGEQTKNAVEAAYKRVKRKINLRR